MLYDENQNLTQNINIFWILFYEYSGTTYLIYIINVKIKLLIQRVLNVFN